MIFCLVHLKVISCFTSLFLFVVYLPSCLAHWRLHKDINNIQYCIKELQSVVMLLKLTTQKEHIGSIHVYIVTVSV